MLSPEPRKVLYENWHWPVLIALAVVFFVVTSSFNYYLQKDGFVKWISPDETANYVFSKLYAQEHAFQIFEKYNLYADDIIHPRSFRSDHGQMKPVSFLGLAIIFGRIASVIGYGVLPYLTPFFGALGIVFFYLLIKRIFSRNNAIISAFLLASFPVFTYYSARSMFHNVLFMSLLIISLYFSTMMGERGSEGRKFDRLGAVCAALAGCFAGLAVITRTSELLWVAPMFLILWVSNIRAVGLFKLLVFISFFLLALMPVLYWNQILYGGPASGGYPEMNKSIANIKEAGSELAKTAFQAETARYKELLSRLKNNIFYFGFRPGDSLVTFYKYFIGMFPWLFWPAALGFLSFLFSWRKLRKKHFLFIAAYLLVSAILVFYYGSWKFSDNVDPSQITIGNSYTRYWLPVYLGAMPFFSLLVIRLTDFRDEGGAEDGSGMMRYLKLSAAGAGRIAAVSLVIFISAVFVLFGSNEGLVETFEKQRAGKTELEKVLGLTEDNAVIITRYHDKLFFPERKVVVGLFNDGNMIREYAKLAEHLPLYYYNFSFPRKDLDYLNEKKLADAGMALEEVEKVTDELTLYKLSLSGAPAANPPASADPEK